MLTGFHALAPAFETRVFAELVETRLSLVVRTAFPFRNTRAVPAKGTEADSSSHAFVNLAKATNQ